MNSAHGAGIIQPKSNPRNWRHLLANPGERDHTVQLYSEVNFLTDVVSHYVGTGLWKGEAVILVVTPAHRDAFLQRLRNSGMDVERRQAMGQLTILDAADTLSQFMVSGSPDSTLFNRLIGSVIDLARVCGGYPRVRAYGEMVNLLWEKGQLDAALRLEELWNDLATTRSFSLHCAYAMDVFDPATHACSALHGVHHVHSYLIAAEDESRLEQALSLAIHEVVGPGKVAELRSETFLHERSPAKAKVADSHTLLLGIAGLETATREAILMQARHRYNVSPPLA
jgi:hypothetical protein